MKEFCSFLNLNYTMMFDEEEEKNKFEYYEYLKNIFITFKGYVESL